ncbi:LysE family transporter [Nonomuraea antimicrobica]
MFFGIIDLWAYVIGAFLIILLPGPNSLYVLTFAARHGVRRGYRAAAGVFVGDTVLMVLSAAGRPRSCAPTRRCSRSSSTPAPATWRGSASR